MNELNKEFEFIEPINKFTSNGSNVLDLMKLVLPFDEYMSFVQTVEKLANEKLQNHPKRESLISNIENVLANKQTIQISIGLGKAKKEVYSRQLSDLKFMFPNGEICKGEWIDNEFNGLSEQEQQSQKEKYTYKLDTSDYNSIINYPLYSISRIWLLIDELNPIIPSSSNEGLYDKCRYISTRWSMLDSGITKPYLTTYNLLIAQFEYTNKYQWTHYEIMR